MTRRRAPCSRPRARGSLRPPRPAACASSTIAGASTRTRRSSSCRTAPTPSSHPRRRARALPSQAAGSASPARRARRRWASPGQGVDGAKPGVEAIGPVHAGIDGEAAELEPPLAFAIRPAALRVRYPPARRPRHGRGARTSRSLGTPRPPGAGEEARRRRRRPRRRDLAGGGRAPRRRRLRRDRVQTPTPGIDAALRRLSRAADRSRLWIACSALLAAFGGDRGRRAAITGLAAIGVTSAVVNLALKPLGNRRRPDRASYGVPGHPPG